MATVMTLMFAVMTLMVMDMTPHVVTVQGGGGEVAMHYSDAE